LSFKLEEKIAGSVGLTAEVGKPIFTFGSGGHLRMTVQTWKETTAVRIEIGCRSDPAEMSGAWPAYRKLSHGRL
jgi:hypothetical protein